MKWRIIFYLFLLMVIATVTTTESHAIEGDKGESVFFGKVGNSTLDRDVNPGVSGIEITAASEKSNAKFQIGSKINDIKRETGQDVGYSYGWKLLFSAPLDSKKDQSEVATLDGLANAFTAKMSYDFFRWPGMEDRQHMLDTVPLREAICEEAKKNFRAEGHMFGDENPESNFCDDPSNIKRFAPGRYAEHQASLIVPAKWSEPKTWRTLLGISAQVGYEELDYFDSTTFEKKQDEKVPWSVGLHTGMMLPSRHVAGLVTIGYDYQESFKNNDEKTVCPASDGSSSVSCITGSFGKPDERDMSLGWIELRGLLPWEIGFSLRYTHDFENNNNGLDLPLFLFRNQANTLNGGLRFGYNFNDNDDTFNAGVFVGSAFSFFD
jgi:hypothetical protein